MKTKNKMIFAVASAATLMVLPWAQAVTGGTAVTGAPTTTVKGTNISSNPNTAMAELFGDPVIAKGKGFEIKRSELDEAMSGIKAAAAAHGQVISPEQETRFERAILQRLIDVQLLLQKATPADKTAGKKAVDEEWSNLLERAGSPEALNQQLQAVGMTEDGLRTKVIQEATANAALERELNVHVTETETTNFYQAHPKEFEQPEMAHVRHILLLTIDPATHEPLSDAKREVKHKQIEDILKRARGGEDFAKLAGEYSEDPSSKAKGGELPPIPKGEMSPAFEAFETTAFSMTNNQISDVITTPQGYDIIKLLDKTPARKLALTDKLPSGEITVSEGIKNYLEKQKLAELSPAYLKKLNQQANVQILDTNLQPVTAPTAPPAAPAGK